MGLLSRALTRPCALRRFLSIIILLCVCALILFLAYTDKRERFTFVSTQEGLDSTKESFDDAKEQGLAPHALTRLLEVPSVHLEEDIRLEHDAVWNVQSRLKPSVEAIADDSHFTEEDPSVTWTLNSTSLESRGRHQRLAMKKFCSEYPSRGVLPSNGTRQNKVLYKHLLYNDEAKIIFCYIPKIGCSNWKRMFAVLQGLVKLTDPKIRPPEEILSAVHNLLDLSPAEREVRLKSYFKFVMVRNPFERIVSVYRNKILPPLTFEHRGLFPDREKNYMLKRFESKRLFAWWNSSRDEGISPSFDSFLKFLIIIKQTRHANEHLLPMLDLCYPCVVDYDVFISFKNLPDDAFRVMDMFGIPHDYYRNVENHPEYLSSDLVELYFGDMSKEERRQRFTAFNEQAAVSIKDSPLSSPPGDVLRALVDAYKDELDFYYTLHPEEKNKYPYWWSLTPHVSAT